jgi:hypothetical protein
MTYMRFGLENLVRRKLPYFLMTSPSESAMRGDALRVNGDFVCSPNPSRITFGVFAQTVHSDIGTSGWWITPD